MTAKGGHILYGRLVSIALLCVTLAIAIEIALAQRREAAILPPVEATSIEECSIEALKKHVGKIDFSGVPIGQAIRILGERSHASLACDVSGESSGVSGCGQPATIQTIRPISLRLRDTTLGEALLAICRQVKASDEQTLEIETDPAGTVLLALEDVGGSHRSAPRFYYVADLIGPAVKFVARPFPIANPNDPLHPLAARPELDELIKALHPFAGTGVIGCFGQELIVIGSWRSRHDIELILQQMRHPISLARMPIRTSSVAFDERTDEATPRAYDVSKIIANSSGWFVGPPARVPPDLPASKEGQLMELVSARVRKLDSGFELRTDEPMISCWKAILVLSVAPKVHDYVFSFLSHLQRTGRPQ